MMIKDAFLGKNSAEFEKRIDKIQVRQESNEGAKNKKPSLCFRGEGFEE